MDSYAEVKRNEMWLVSAHIAPYTAANQFNHEPTRPRKLLMSRKEIDRLSGKLQEQGLTLVPLSLYFKEGRVKAELGLAKGKKNFDKRETIKRRESDRDLSRLTKLKR